MTPRKDEDAYRHFTIVMRLRIECVTYSEVNMSVEFLCNCVVGANPAACTKNAKHTFMLWGRKKRGRSLRIDFLI